ncbi:MAG: hypothetical protein GTN76_05255 [Candidatus Aenigmarchaeota archaeon]|nr:hypothetical protein [Candidatus Aenigmarchaeota archaeon]
MKLYCHVCSIEYHTVMGDLHCPLCGRPMDTERRANRCYDIICTLGVKDGEKKGM